MMHANPVVSFWRLLALSSVVLLCGCPRPQVTALQTDADNVRAIREALAKGQAAGDGAAGAQAARPTGWGTIRGKFTLTGAAPSLRQLTVDKDQSICAPGGKSVFAEDLVVDGAGGIKDVVVYLTTKIPLDDPAFIHPDYEAARNAEVVFDQKQCIFLTHLFVARTSNRIVLKNSDPVGHNTKIDGKGSASVNVNMSANDSTAYLPGKESPEPFDVSCSVHNWMSAKMLIRDTPYFAVTGPDGSFEIRNVPAGVPLDFRVWQEKLKFIQGGTLNGAEARWPRKGYAVTLQPDAVHEMIVEVPAPAQ